LREEKSVEELRKLDGIEDAERPLQTMTRHEIALKIAFTGT